MKLFAKKLFNNDADALHKAKQNFINSVFHIQQGETCKYKIIKFPKMYLVSLMKSITLSLSSSNIP